MVSSSTAARRKKYDIPSLGVIQESSWSLKLPIPVLERDIVHDIHRIRHTKDTNKVENPVFEHGIH